MADEEVNINNLLQPAQSSEEAIERLLNFGYAFNAAGELRKVDPVSGLPGEEPFKFEVSEKASENQRHYEQLAQQIPEIIYALLESNGLKRTYIPKDAKPPLHTFVFSQPAKLMNSKKLLILIHGSGYVRAGQWARSLIINNSLEHGSQLPYIQQAQKLGYDILVTNTNDNSRKVNGQIKTIEGSHTPTSHAEYVWKHIVVPSKPEAVAIVAHSYGGCVTFDMVSRFTKFFEQKVFAIALTDSAHGGRIDKANKNYLHQVTKNWASSDEPLDTPMPTRNDIDVPRVSAGHPRHEWSSYAARESVFKFLELRYAQHVTANLKK